MADLESQSPRNHELEIAPGLILVGDLGAPVGSRQRLARSAADGVIERVRRGAYVSQEAWAALDMRARHVLRMRAVQATLVRRPVFSHWSAAAVHALPVLENWPESVHVRVPPGWGARRGSGIIRHAMPLEQDEIVEVAGLLVTSVPRTVVDLAADCEFQDAVAIADAAVHVERSRAPAPLTTLAELHAQLARRMPFRGHARARAVVGFATPLSGSPLESASRAGMWLGGFPRPALQVGYRDRRGHIGEVDFDWPEHGLIGEADGEVKYRDPRLRGGRTAEEVVVAEKWREDRLRALGLRVVRWGWHTARNPAALAEVLEHAGLPRSRRRTLTDEW